MRPVPCNRHQTDERGSMDAPFEMAAARYRATASPNATFAHERAVSLSRPVFTASGREQQGKGPVDHDPQLPAQPGVCSNSARTSHAGPAPAPQELAELAVAEGAHHPQGVVDERPGGRRAAAATFPASTRRAQGVLGQSGVRLAVRAGTAAQSPSAHTSGRLRHRGSTTTRHACPAHRQPRDHRVGDRPAARTIVSAATSPAKWTGPGSIARTRAGSAPTLRPPPDPAP